MSLEAELLAEIERWSQRLDQSLSAVAAEDDSGKKLLDNIEAYRKDSRHFVEKNDLIRGYECLIWAWAFLEIGKMLGHLTQR